MQIHYFNLDSKPRKLMTNLAVIALSHSSANTKFDCTLDLSQQSLVIRAMSILPTNSQLMK